MSNFFNNLNDFLERDWFGNTQKRVKSSIGPRTNLAMGTSNKKSGLGFNPKSELTGEAGEQYFPEKYIKTERSNRLPNGVPFNVHFIDVNNKKNEGKPYFSLNSDTVSTAIMPAPKFIEDDYSDYDPTTTKINPLDKVVVSTPTKTVSVKKSTTKKPKAKRVVVKTEPKIREKAIKNLNKKRLSVYNIMDADNGLSGRGIDW